MSVSIPYDQLVVMAHAVSAWTAEVIDYHDYYDMHSVGKWGKCQIDMQYFHICLAEERKGYI